MQIRRVSAYRAVADAIGADIKAGVYPRGSQLPTQEELATRYGVDQATVSRALRVLNACGLTINRRGLRSIVMPIPTLVRDASARYRRAHREQDGAGGAYDAQIRALGLTPRVELSVHRGRPPARVAQLLRVDPGSESAIVRSRVMWADDVITQLADSYVSVELFGGTVLEQDEEGVGGMISRMAELGHAQAYVVEERTGRPPTAQEAAQLGISEDQFVFEIEHVGYTADDRPVEVTVHVMPQSLWKERTRFEID